MSSETNSIDQNEEKQNHCHAAGYSTACMWMSADIKSNR